jgi:hypothetical protein
LIIYSSPRHDRHCYNLSPFQAHLGKWHCTHLLRLAYLLTVHMESGPSPFSCGVFLPPPLLQAFPLLLAGVCCHSCLLQLAFLFTVPWGIAPPHSLALRIAYSVFFFSLGGGWSVQVAMLI